MGIGEPWPVVAKKHKQLFVLALVTISINGIKAESERGHLATAVPAANYAAIPLTDFQPGELYLDTFAGLLYENSNTPPSDHDTAGIAAAANVVPRDVNGVPDSNGKIVAITMGMSNWTIEMCKTGGSDWTTICDPETFIARATGNAGVNASNLVLVNCATGMQTAYKWADDTFGNYSECLNSNLAPRGLSEQQVQVAIWLNADSTPQISMSSSPGTAPSDYCVAHPAVDACAYEGHMGNMLRYARSRYANLSQLFLQSRVYGGYATTPLNPEPYAYEYGFATKWLIQAQIDQSRSSLVDPVAGDLSPAVAPWVGWGAYLWAPGDSVRADGLSYNVGDFSTADYTHPGTGAVKKIAKQMMNSYLASSYTPWFRSGAIVNQSPTVHAGPDAAVSIPAVLSLNGYVSDEGSVTTTWSMASGPGTVNFSSPDTMHTEAAFSVAGTYVLRITADDGDLSSTDDVVVVATGGNQAPVANAGVDRTVVLPASVSLVGTATDDGVPGTTVVPIWSKISGPGNVFFNPAGQLATQAYFTAKGTYTLRLTVSDTELSAFDDLVVTATGTADKVNPVASITAPTNNSNVMSGDVTIAATATDSGSGINRVIFLVDDAEISVNAASPYSAVWNNAGLPLGSVHTIKVTAVDNVERNSTVAITVTIAETIPPTVSITSPVNGAIVARGTTVTIAADAADNVGVAKVEFYVKNVLKCTDAVAPYTCAWAVPSAKDALYNLHAKAFDTSNNVTTSATVNVTGK